MSETTRTHLTWTSPNFLELPGGPSKIKYSSTRLRMSNGDGGIGGKPHGVGKRDGVIIVDHGSRRKESNLMLSKL